MKKTVAFSLALAMMISLCAIFSGCGLIHVQDGFYFWEVYDDENPEEVIGYKISGCTKKVKKKDVIEIPSEIRGKPVLSITGSEDGFEGALATKIIVPEGVTRIVSGFENCPNLETVELPESLVQMFEGVFEGSPKVGTVENGFHYVDGWVVAHVESDHYILRDDTVGVADFVDLRGIIDAEGNVHFPEGLRSIGDDVLKDAVIKGDVTFPSTIKQMGFTVLENAEVLGTVTFSEGITKLYNNVLYRSKISRVVINCTNLYFEDGGWEGVFPGCKIGELVVNSSGIGYEASVAKDGMYNAAIERLVTHAAALAFLPASPKTLEVTYGSVPQGAFKQRNIEELILGGGVTSVGSTAFAACENLASLTVKNADLALAPQAFYQTAIKTVTAPATVLCTLPTFACTKLVVTSGVISSDTLGDMSKITDLTLYDTVSTVAAGALSGCTSLKIATVPARFVAALPKAKLTELTVTDGTSLDGAALVGATALTKVTLSEGLTAIGADAFAEATALKAVHYGGTVADWAKINFANAAANPLLFAKMLYVDNAVVIEAMNLTSVSSYAFAGYAALAQVTFASSLDKIGEGAFAGCTGLTALSLGAALAEIGIGAFAGCDNVAEVHFADAEGWARTERGSTSYSPIHNYYLEDAARAANLLTVTYAEYLWKKI